MVILENVEAKEKEFLNETKLKSKTEKEIFMKLRDKEKNKQWKPFCLHFD